MAIAIAKNLESATKRHSLNFLLDFKLAQGAVNLTKAILAIDMGKGTETVKISLRFKYILYGFSHKA